MQTIDRRIGRFRRAPIPRAILFLETQPSIPHTRHSRYIVHVGELVLSSPQNCGYLPLNRVVLPRHLHSTYTRNGNQTETPPPPPIRLTLQVTKIKKSSVQIPHIRLPGNAQRRTLGMPKMQSVAESRDAIARRSSPTQTTRNAKPPLPPVAQVSSAVEKEQTTRMRGWR